MALACFGLANRGEAGKPPGCLPAGSICKNHNQCCSGSCVLYNRTAPRVCAYF
jgi:hypothetical protein